MPSLPGSLLGSTQQGSSRRTDLVNGSISALTSDATLTRTSSAGVWVGSTYTTIATGLPRWGVYELGDTFTGLIVEGARTNGVRNSTMVGAVVGTPGTLPTNTSIAGTAGLTTDVIATGTVNGLSYMDIRIHGTTNTTASWSYGFDGSAGIVASSGQTWSSSCYVAIVNGGTTNLSSINLFTQENTSGGAFVSGGASSDVKGTLTSSLSRMIHTRTFSGGGTVAAIRTLLIVQPTGNGVAVDITLRIAATQCEVGNKASTFIPTSTVAVTRAADVITITNLSTKPWFNVNAGTVFADFSIDYLDTVNAAAIWSISDGTNSNRIYSKVNIASSRTANTIITAGGVAQMDSTTANAITAAAESKLATAWRLDDGIAILNNGTAVTDSSMTIPTVTTINIGTGADGGEVFYGVINKLTYYSTRLATTTLQAITI